MEHMQQDSTTKILLVDDIPANLELLISYLGEKFSTAIARDGEVALRRAERYQPDLILLDIQMPKMDGFEVCRRLKANEATKNIPVIFMSARDETTDKLKGFELGGQDYITKPINCYELIARINTHLMLRKVQEELRQKNSALENREQQRKRVEQILRHDIKSPLQAIMSIPEILAGDNNLTEHQRSLLNMILEASNQILEMVNSSLTLYKIENNAYTGKFQPLSLLRELEKVVQAQQVEHRAQQLFLSFEGRSVEPKDYDHRVLGEPFLLNSLFSNLLKNAVEASTEGGTVSINIVLETTAVVIFISNKGSVPEEIRESFFDEFVTVGKTHGTGLGTYSAKLITTTLQGTIELNSAVEGETTIVVSLPLYL